MTSVTRRRLPWPASRPWSSITGRSACPTSVRELGHDLNESEIQLLAEKCARPNPNLGGFKTLSQDDMIQIFRMARG